MTAFAAKTVIHLAIAEAASLANPVPVFSTPEVLRERLGDLARLQFLSAEWCGHINASASTTAIVLFELMAADTVVDSYSLEMNGQSANGFRKEADLYAVGGSQRLWVRVTVSTEEAAIDSTVSARLSVSQPLSVSGC